MMKWRSSTRKNGDQPQEELVLFRDMHRDRILNLLQPDVSDDLLDSNSLYRLPSAKRSSGLGLEADDKNDYDWLKTPPATPLFPSLEMEVNAPELALQREIPIIQPLSRFAGGSSEQATKATSKSPLPKPKIPSRSVTPGVARPSNNLISTTPPAPTRPLRPITPSAMRVQEAPQPELAPKIIQSNNKNSISTTKLSANQRENTFNSLAASLNTGKDSKSKSSGRVRSRTPAASIPVGFSDDEKPPPNLRTDRSSSASRGRPLNPTSATIHPKQESVKPRRQSCSPSMARGRKTEEIEVDKNMMKVNNHLGNGSLAFGSKMVEKVMNARKSVPIAQEKEAKLKATTAMHESSGFGGIKSKSSLGMALKHMEIRRNPTTPRQVQPANDSILVGVKSNSNLSNQASQVQATWKQKEARRF